MTDGFESEVMLEVQIQESSLRDSRRKLERELNIDPVTVQAEASSNRQPVAGMGGTSQVSQALDVKRNKHLEEIREDVEKLAVAGSGGGGGGGGSLLPFMAGRMMGGGPGASGLLSMLGMGALGTTGGLMAGTLGMGIGALALMDDNLTEEQKAGMRRNHQAVRTQAESGNMDVMTSPYARDRGPTIDPETGTRRRDHIPSVPDSPPSPSVATTGEGAPTASSPFTPASGGPTWLSRFGSSAPEQAFTPATGGPARAPGMGNRAAQSNSSNRAADRRAQKPPDVTVENHYHLDAKNVERAMDRKAAEAKREAVREIQKAFDTR